MSNLKSLDKLLDGESPITVVNVGSPSSKKGVFGLMVATLALAVGAGALYMHNNKDESVKLDNPSLIQAVKTQIKESVHMTPQENQNKLYGNFVSDPAKKAQIEEAGNFVLENGMKSNQVSRFVAQKMYTTAGYMGYTASLISEREGFVKGLYSDIGWFAMGNGFNLSMQSKQHIKNVVGTVSTDQAYINELSNLSGKKITERVPENYKNITITPQKSIQVALVMSQAFEDSVINSFSKQLNNKEKAKEVFNSLKDNEKAALVNFAYQKGSLSSTETKSILNYAKDTDKTVAKAMAAVGVVSISYMTEGQRITDVRAETLGKTMFTNPELYGKVIKDGIKPKDIAEYSSIFNNKVKIQDGKTVIDDPIGDAKALAEKEGRILRMNIAPDIDIDGMRKKPVTHNTYSFG